MAPRMTWPKPKSAIDRAARLPADEGLVLRDIWLLRLRALLARARGDDVAYRDLAESLPRDGGIAWLRRTHGDGRGDVRVTGAEAVVGEREAAAAPVRLDRGGGPQRHVAVVVEVVAVGQAAAVLPEDLTVPLAHHLREVAIVGLLAHLDAGGVPAAGAASGTGRCGASAPRSARSRTTRQSRTVRTP